MMRLRAWRGLVAAIMVSGCSVAAVAEPAVTVRGDWAVRRDLDRFSDTENVIALRLTPDFAALMARCLDRRLSMLVKTPTPDFRGQATVFVVTFRADKNQPIVTLGEALDDGTVEIGVIDPMLTQLAAAREVAFRFQTDRARFDRVFSTGRGAKAAVELVVAACPAAGK